MLIDALIMEVEMAEHDLMHRIEEAIHSIFLENKNQPLDIDEIVLRVEKQLRNGKVDATLTKQIIEKMLDRFALLTMPDGKLVLYS